MKRWWMLAVAGVAGALLVVLAWWRSTLRSDSEPSDCPIGFEEPVETGIDFVHTDGSSGGYYIVETVSTGLATFDYDGDGLIDIYFPNGAPLRGAPSGQPPRHALYKNLGNWKFRDVTEEAGVVCNGYGLGAAVADYDNDGWPDLYLTNYGPKILFRNNGNGTFTDVTARAGVADGNKVGGGVCFLDIDGDGRLDLYVANYVRFTYETNVVFSRAGYAEYAGPKSYPPETHTLYRNRGDGTFADVSAASGIASRPGPGMGAVCGDYDNDGATDIFVLNDVSANFLWHNDGHGRFEEVALLSGAAYNGAGDPLGNMGVDCGDYDNDGLLDFFSTSYQNQLPVLFHNLGNGAFDDATARTGAGAGSGPYVKWGCGFVDFDNDGRRDLFVGCGHLQDSIDHYDASTAYRCRNVALRNSDGNQFVNVSGPSGLDVLAPHSARGVAFDDLDNDGDIDVVIVNSREAPTLLRNMYYERGGRGHRLDLQLRGTKTNRDGVGARVTVIAGDLTQIDEVHSGRGYQSHWGSRLHFGLAGHDRVDRIEVRWCGGAVEVFEGVPVDQLTTLVEGTGRKQSKGQ